MPRRSLLSRRQFVRAAAGVFAAPVVLPARVFGQTAPSERLTVGIIGVGLMGTNHVNWLLGRRDVQLVAVCDVDRGAREKAQQTVNKHYADQTASGSYVGCDAYLEYEALLARDDIDAVVIATPDHWHANIAIAACRAGKDVYCEKPLTLTVREGRQIVDAARRYGAVFQTGSQQRSDHNFRFACEMVRSGRIGKVQTVTVGIGGPSGPAYLPGQPIPDGFDWDRWLGPTHWYPYNFTRREGNYGGGWRHIWDYSGGLMTDWGAHHFDIAQWGLGMDDSGPVEIIPPNGKDVELLTYKYANGVTMVRGEANGVLFAGTDGKIEVNRGYLRTWPDDLMKTPIGPGEVHLYESAGHHDDWIECIRTRKQPICTPEIGTRSVTVCHLGNIAYWLKRPLRWDPAKERIIGDEAACRWLDRPKRPPYAI